MGLAAPIPKLALLPQNLACGQRGQLCELAPLPTGSTTATASLGSVKTNLKISHTPLTVHYIGGANLSQANLNRANLNGTDLNGANLSRSNLAEADLIRTRRLPAERLHADLWKNGVHCWFAPEDMKIGNKIRPPLDLSIRFNEKLLLVLSEQSMARRWVEREIEIALGLEREQGGTLVLYPVRQDNAVMKIKSGWPALIQNTRHIGDFSNWKDPTAYRRAFEQLLKDLKAEKK